MGNTISVSILLSAKVTLNCVCFADPQVASLDRPVQLLVGKGVGVVDSRNGKSNNFKAWISSHGNGRGLRDFPKEYPQDIRQHI